MNLNSWFCRGFFVAILFASSLGYSKRDAEYFVLCQRCHGVQGEGDFALKAPAIAGQPGWYLENQLNKFKNGVRGAHPEDVDGMRMMPMAGVISSEADIQGLAKFLAEMPASLVEPTMDGNPLLGKKTYDQICIACHGKAAEGNKLLSAPRLTGLQDWYMFQQLKNFKSGIRAGNIGKDPIGAGMAAMVQSLSEEELKDVVIYIGGL